MAAPVFVEKCSTEYKHIFHPELLRGKCAFITGGATGIGFTIAEILMRHGCDTVIASRKLENLKRSAATLQEATGRICLPVQMDVRKPQDILAAVDTALSRFNKIDILVNNAAGNFLSPISGLSFNAFKTVMEIDALGTFNTSKAVFEKCLQANGGVILNISATLPYRGQVFQAHAGTAKAAIDALTKHMAVEWGPNKVRVVGLAPGPIRDTEGARRLGGGEAAMADRIREIPCQRAGSRLEMAHCALFLVSEAASYVTGETLVADGGSWLAWPNSMQEATARMEAVMRQQAGIKSKM